MPLLIVPLLKMIMKEWRRAAAKRHRETRRQEKRFEHVGPRVYKDVQGKLMLEPFVGARDLREVALTAPLVLGDWSD